jgi:hypothetical protein
MFMKILRSFLAAALAASIAGLGCATLFGGGSSQSIPMNVSPSGAKITVKDASGAVVAKGEAPMTLNFKRSSGLFAPAKYYISIEKDGRKPFNTAIESTLNGWYWG